MGVFDLIVAVIVLISVLVGFTRGFMREAFSLIKWILAFWIARAYFVEFGDYVSQFLNITAPHFRAIVGFTLLFIGSLIVLGLLGWLIIKVLVPDVASLGDRVLGAVLGVARGAVFVIAALMVAKGFGAAGAQWWENSVSVSVLEPAMTVIEDMFPDSGWFADDQEVNQADETTSAFINAASDELAKQSLRKQ